MAQMIAYKMNYLMIVLGLLGTMGVYFVNKKIYQVSGRKLYLQPICLCPVILCLILVGFHIDYTSYAQGANFISYMLTPATVAFAVPLYKYREVIRTEGVRLCLIISVACVVAMMTSMGLGYIAHVGVELEMSLAPRSVTTPLAMSASHVLGGNPTITAVLVIVTGVMGMMIASLFIRKTKINNYVLRGLLLGITAHGTGTAKAYEFSDKTGMIASISMIIMGIVTTILAPAILALS